MPVAVVTGANKGIGLAIVRALINRYPRSDLSRRYNAAPLLIYLTARNRERGENAVADLRSRSSEFANEARKTTHVEFRQLDVTDDASVLRFSRDLAAERHAVDILVNNAGVAIDGFDGEKARQTLETNYHGTLRLTRALLPTLIPPQGRIVNMSSMVGKLNKYSPSITTAFRAASIPSTPSTPSTKEQEQGEQEDPTAATTALMQSYQDAVTAAFSPSTSTSSSGSESTQSTDPTSAIAAKGWPVSSYAVSKAGVASATLALAAHEAATRPEDARLINACCPGYVATDMTKGRGRKSAEQGAETPALLAISDIGGVTGRFWERGEVSEW